ncbi:unnamed protein product [Cladocopium goreaui]|uniref:Glutathione synthetase n=1 Tax=Cladocopium goreaui TaxID=2562237 RepID=A0A9P1GH85_9DINO|nr:unnamed protein product [Cladocopium goreaui]
MPVKKLKISEELRSISRLLLDEGALKQLTSAELVEDALALAVARGVVMYPTPQKKREASVVPLTLLPSPVADDCFHLAKMLTPDFHILMDRVCCDLSWLQDALAKTGAIDEISCKLLEICCSVYNSTTGKDPKDDIRLHLMRNDFMLDTQKGPAEGAMVQIELNMMSASFATHGQDLTEVHRYLLTKYLPRDANLRMEAVSEALSAALPTSSATEGMAEAMSLADKAYKARWQPTGLLQVVLFVALEEEKNELDHRKLELAAFRHGLVALRRSLQQLKGAELRPLAPRPNHTATVREPLALVVDGYEATVVYFRSGYWPQHFVDAWPLRQQMERAEAVKCPSAPAQLAGMKKVQQLLCERNELLKFLPEDQATAVSSTFGKQFDPSSSSKETREAVEAARAHPGDWVLKPQVEGSGELFFDEDIPRILDSRTQEQLAEFILMERVRPPCTPSAILHQGEVVLRSAVAELGIFGTFVAEGGEVRCNKAVGHLLRSKGQQTNQGGVFVGNATVDVPFLTPNDIFWHRVKS